MEELSYKDRLRVYISVFWFLVSTAYAAGTYEPGDSISMAFYVAIIPVIAIWLIAFVHRAHGTLVILSATWLIVTIAAVTVNDNGISIDSLGQWVSWVIMLTIIPLLGVWISRREFV